MVWRVLRTLDSFRFIQPIDDTVQCLGRPEPVWIKTLWSSRQVTDKDWWPVAQWVSDGGRKLSVQWILVTERPDTSGIVGKLHPGRSYTPCSSKTPDLMRLPLPSSWWLSVHLFHCYHCLPGPSSAFLPIWLSRHSLVPQSTHSSP